MSYVGRSPAETESMLSAIGVARIEELFESVPAGVRLGRPLEVPGPLSEIELRRLFAEWARENVAGDGVISFAGGGLYEHYIPSALHAVASRSEFVTAYTPYQPEVAQGTLTAIFEFQSMIAELFGTDVANASLYDGATAAAEAALLARAHTGRPRVVVAGAVHPRTGDVLRTYLDPADVKAVPERGGQCALDDLQSALGADVAAVLYQVPNFFGLVESPPALNAAAHGAGALAIAMADPIAMALLEPPGSGGAAGADIVVGEGQCLGNPVCFGGPLLGLFGCRRELVRRMPGRLAAQTVDRDGRRGFVLTLQTREQHIRREKATSNICTNQGLLALRATVYLGLLGRQGLREVAELCFHKTHYAAERAAALPGYRLPHGSGFFREFVLECPLDARAVVERGLAERIVAGVDLGQFRPEWRRWLLVAATEQRTRADIDRWADLLRRAGAGS
jgi:glycine dehydrogenase subunit 1